MSRGNIFSAIQARGTAATNQASSQFEYGYSELIKKALFGLAEVINIDSRMEPP